MEEEVQERNGGGAELMYAMARRPKRCFTVSAGKVGLVL